MPYAKRYKSTGFASKGRRVRSAVASGGSARSAYLARKRAMQPNPGYTRTGGYYGRFQGAAGESKFYDQLLSATIDTTGTNELSLVTIAQGVTESTRVGRKCTVTSINLKGYVLWAVNQAYNTMANTRVKIVVCQDTQANGAACGWTDVYQSSTTIALRNLANSQRFKILKEWIVTPSSLAMTTTDNWATVANTVGLAPCTKLKFNKKCQIPIEFSSTTGAVTELRTNNICIMAVSDLGDDVHTLQLQCRVRFTDN